MADKLGIDLTVTPHFVAHDASALDLAKRVRPIRRARPDQPQETVDLDRIAGRQNVAQALILRLLTPRGALAGLGHPDYGSRLSELIGRLKSEELRNLCRAFVLEAVAQEPRVEPKALSLNFDLLAERFDNFVFTLAVKPRTDAAPVEIGLEVGL
jgi:phage baseplate assembly protein W